MDKDQSEIAAAKEVAPHAEIHLCDFHVKDSFERAGKQKQGKEYMEKVHPVIVDMIHAHTEEEFKASYEKLQTVGNDSFMKYYHKQWHNSDLVWTDYKRNATFNLKERTTGKLESQNGKIKIAVSKQVPVAELVFRLCMQNSNKEMDLLPI